MGTQEDRRNKLAEKLYWQLRNEAEEMLKPLNSRLQDLAIKIYTAKMILYAVGGDESFLKDDERSVLADREKLVDEIEAEINFWEGRLTKLKKYEPATFFSKFQSDVEIDELLKNLGVEPEDI